MSLYTQLNEELDALTRAGNLRTLPTLTHRGKKIVYEGREMLNLSSNDYLGLATDEDLRAQFLECVTPSSFLPSASSSRLLTGNFSAYDELEDLLASLYGTEAALVFNCGYHANTGILPAIADSQTLILADKLVHASLIDGLKLGKAKFLRFNHNDYLHLLQLLETHANAYRQVIVVVESVYSMDGDVADIQQLVRMKHTFSNLLLYVDEAHGVGVFGESGLGLCQACNCLSEVDFLVGTFGKALASTGAFVVCKSVVRRYLINKMRPFVFTTALPPWTIEWTTFVMKHLAQFGEERVRLHRFSVQVREAIEQLDVCCVSQSQIVPWIVGESSHAINLARHFQHHGFYCQPVRPPTVPSGMSRIRFSLSAAFTAHEIETLIASFPSIQLSNQHVLL